MSGTLAARGIAPEHLTAAHLRDRLSVRRVADARRWASLPEPVNRDLRPTTYRLGLESALAEFGDAGLGVLVVLAIALALGALLLFGPRRRPVQFAVMTSGSTSLATQLVIALAYQIAAGALYREMGLLLAGFMLGAAAGAFVAARRAWTVLGLDLAQIGLPLVLWALLPAAVDSGAAARPLMFAATFVTGFLPGAQFAAARRVSAGALYAADLAGAALAALLTFTVLVPLCGVRHTLLLVAGLKVLSAVALALPAPAERAAEGSRLGWAVPVLLIAFLLAVVAERTEAPLYELTFSRGYQVVVLLGLLVVLLAAFEPRRLRDVWSRLGRRFAGFRERMGLPGGRLVWFLLLLPVAAFPLARCYFSVPFLFCHVCPRQCVFGFLRPYVIPVALLANLGDQRFCERVCPLGTTQAACEHLRRERARRVLAVRFLRYLSLGFVVLAYALAETSHRAGIEGGSFFSFFYKNGFTPSFWVLLVAGVLLLGSFFLRRPFCEGLCPVGAVSSLVERIGRPRA